MPSSLNEDRGVQVRAHLLQTYAGEELKAAFGWQVLRVESGKAAAQTLLRQLLIGLRLAHVPRGPWGHWLPELLPALDEACRAAGDFALTVEPHALGDAALADELGARGFRPSRETTRPRRTLVGDLRGSEDDLLACMHPKARYTTRLAAKKGVRLEAYGERMQHTPSCDRYGARRPSYCTHAHALFHSAGASELGVATHRVRICSASAPCTAEALSCDGRPSRRSRIARQDHGEAPLSARSAARR
jgi:lipid II:glycine glycyltransferase (peptidoglycan interpeptide bridge formation enzyme)